LFCGLYPAGRAERDTRRSSSKIIAEIIEKTDWLKSIIVVRAGKKGGKVQLMPGLTPNCSGCTFFVPGTNKE
jgi:hypothetical protein